MLPTTAANYQDRVFGHLQISNVFCQNDDDHQRVRGLFRIIKISTTFVICKFNNFRIKPSFSSLTLLQLVSFVNTCVLVVNYSLFTDVSCEKLPAVFPNDTLLGPEQNLGCHRWLARRQQVDD